MARKLQVALFCLAVVGPPAALGQESYTALQLQRAEKQVFEQLKNPWYKVELILFERLSVLSFNTEEELISTAVPKIPAGISQLAEPDPLVLSDRWQPDLEWCHGFPMLPYRLVPHATTAAAMSPPLPPGYQSPMGSGDEELADTTAERPTPIIGPTIAPPKNVEPATATAAQTAGDPTPAEIFAQDLAAFERSLVAQSLVALEDLSLATEVKLINRRHHLRPLLHLSWLQVPASREVLTPIAITAPETSPRVFGHLGLSLGRYLHFAADLRYQLPAVAWQPLPANAQPANIDPDAGYIHFRESRRMRSGELHYLDHPKLGMIVRADPVKVPEPLVRQWLSLKSP